MSSSRNHDQSSFPTVPSSLSTGDHGMRDYYAEQEHTAARPAAHSLDDITPYLGLRARLSQVWLNKWTILILLVLVRVLIALGSLRDLLDSAEAKALSACTSVESMGSAMASMPHYMAQGTNELAAKGVEKAVNGLQEMLFMSITAVEEIFVFVINVLYGTYECLITFAVGGALHVAVKIAEDATKFLNQTLGDIGNDISKGVDDFEGGFNSFLSGLSSVPSIFGGSVEPPKIDLTNQIDALKDVKLPDDINKGLDELNKNIPNFEQVHNFTNSVLRLPFEEVKKLINSSLGPYEFDRSLFPVPEKEAMTFCSDDNGISSFFDSLYGIADTAHKVFIVVLILAAILACVPMTIAEIRRWRTMQDRAALVSKNAHDPMDVIYIASRPYTAGAGLKLSRNFASPRRQVLTRWFVAYATSTPALLVLAIAMAGFFSCLCQYILLQAVKREVPGLAGQVGAFADKVVDKLDAASSNWANGTNTAILKTNQDINNDVFGWVNTSTGALNETLNVFINQTTDVLEKAFGGTILEDPIKEVFNCLIGLKVQNIQKGLTWIHDHAHIDFPLFPNDTFSQGAAKALSSNDESFGTNASGDSFLADPGSGASDKITEAVVRLIDKLTDGIRTEALIATGVFLIWVTVVLMGLGRVLFLFCRRDKTRAEGGASYAGDIDPHNDRAATFDPFDANRAPVGHQQSGFAAEKASPEAPAYEEGSGGRFQAFRNPMRAIRDTRAAFDEKVGYAGQREPPARGDGRGVVSEYGFVEDEKSNRI